MMSTATSEVMTITTSGNNTHRWSEGEKGTTNCVKYYLYNVFLPNLCWERYAGKSAHTQQSFPGYCLHSAHNIPGSRYNQFTFVIEAPLEQQLELKYLRSSVVVNAIVFTAHFWDFLTQDSSVATLKVEVGNVGNVVSIQQKKISKLLGMCDLYTSLTTESCSSASISTSVLHFQLTCHVCHPLCDWLWDCQKALIGFRGLAYRNTQLSSLTLLCCIHWGW